MEFPQGCPSEVLFRLLWWRPVISLPGADPCALIDGCSVPVSSGCCCLLLRGSQGRPVITLSPLQVCPCLSAPGWHCLRAEALPPHLSTSRTPSGEVSSRVREQGQEGGGGLGRFQKWPAAAWGKGPGPYLRAGEEEVVKQEEEKGTGTGKGEWEERIFLHLQDRVLLLSGSSHQASLYSCLNYSLPLPPPAGQGRVAEPLQAPAL